MGLTAHIVYGVGLRKWRHDQRSLLITKRQNKEGLARNEIGLASSESRRRLSCMSMTERTNGLRAGINKFSPTRPIHITMLGFTSSCLASLPLSF